MKNYRYEVAEFEAKEVILQNLTDKKWVFLLF